MAKGRSDNNTKRLSPDAPADPTAAADGAQPISHSQSGSTRFRRHIKRLERRLDKAAAIEARRVRKLDKASARRGRIEHALTEARAVQQAMMDETAAAPTKPPAVAPSAVPSTPPTPSAPRARPSRTGRSSGARGSEPTV